MKPLEFLSEMGSAPTLGRFVLLECDSFDELICLPEVSPHFALFTAFDLSQVRPLDWDDEDRPKGEPPDVVTTSWHDGEPLEEALFFFGRLALPTPRYAENCRDYVIAAAPNYVDLVRKVIRALVLTPTCFSVILRRLSVPPA